MRKKIIIAAALLFAAYQSAQAQEGTPAKNIQPKIMVIPRVPETEDMKTFYDTSFNIQVAIAKINESFQKRGANLRMFDAALKQVTQNANINKTSGAKEDYKTKVVALSGADIYVEVKLQVVNHAGRGAKSVTVILEAFQAGTSNSIGSKTGRSPMFQTDDIGLLVDKAMDQISEELLNLMQLKFDDIRLNGQSAYVEFSINQNSELNFDSEIKGRLLSGIIDEWFEKNSVNGAYNNQGVSENSLIISDVRIPLKKRNNPNSNYNNETLYTEIYTYLKTFGVNVKRAKGDPNKLIINIQ